MDSFSDPPEPKTCCFGGLPSKSADFSVPHWNLVFLLMGASDDSKQATESRKTCPKHIHSCQVSDEVCPKVKAICLKLDKLLVRINL